MVAKDNTGIARNNLLDNRETTLLGAQEGKWRMVVVGGRGVLEGIAVRRFDLLFLPGRGARALDNCVGKTISLSGSGRRAISCLYSARQRPLAHRRLVHS